MVLYVLLKGVNPNVARAMVILVAIVTTLMCLNEVCQFVAVLAATEVVLIAGGVCYLVDMLTAFLVPDLGKQLHGFLAIPPTVAEIWTLGYLLVNRVRVLGCSQRT